jgi:tritrans,polycis-undecaprenyl-diphosphate synthase [geranylgeranyl-diphosphate specific]
MFLNIAIAYGGQKELVDAIKKIVLMVRSGKIKEEDIDEKVIESCLYTSHLPQPEPDLILRTSGEKRLSGFLVWQSAYSELVFMDVFWPGKNSEYLMPEHGNYNSDSQKWFCNYWMTLQEWKDLHDYMPQNITLHQREEGTYHNTDQILDK